MSQGMSSTDVIAPIELGTLVSTILYGVMCTQAYSYTQRFKKSDPLGLRIFLLTVIVLETLHLVLIFIHLYTLTITHYNDLRSLDDVSWSFAATFTVTSVSDSMVQAFYARRIYTLTGRWFLLVPPYLCILARSTDGIYVTARMLYWGKMSTFAASDSYMCILNLALKLSTDFYITVALCWILARRRSDWHQATRSLVDKLIVWTAEVGLLNSICSFIVLTLILSLNNMVWTFFVVISPRIISNSLFAMLNGRSSLNSNTKLQVSSSHSGIEFAAETSSPITYAHGSRSGAGSQAHQNIDMRSKGTLQTLAFNPTNDEFDEQKSDSTCQV